MAGGKLLYSANHKAHAETCCRAQYINHNTDVTALAPLTRGGIGGECKCKTRVTGPYLASGRLALSQGTALIGKPRSSFLPNGSSVRLLCYHCYCALCRCGRITLIAADVNKTARYPRVFTLPGGIWQLQPIQTCRRMLCTIT